MMLVTMISGKRETDYLSQTLESVTPQIVESGFPCRLFFDAWRTEVPAPWQIEVRGREGEPTGTRRMMKRSLEYFVNETEEDRLLYLEDDILICRNFIKYAAQLEIKEVWAIVSFHDARIRSIGRPGVVSMPTCKFLYTQAFVMARGVVKRLIDTEMDWQTAPRGITDGSGSDKKLARLMREQGFVRYGLQLPSLIRHCGLISTRAPSVYGCACGNPSFPGVEFDALSLLG